VHVAPIRWYTRARVDCHAPHVESIEYAPGNTRAARRPGIPPV